MKVLERLLRDYNDGRRKSFFCAAVNLLDIQDVNAVMKQLAKEVKQEADQKTKVAAAVRLFEEMASSRGISLLLRKKNKT